MKDKLLLLAFEILHQTKRKNGAADDKHLLEGDLEIIEKKAEELFNMIQNPQYETKAEMSKFNLNENILVQITDYGKEHLVKRSGQEFWDAVIDIRKVVIEGEDWYKLQAHIVAECFGEALWSISHSPIKSNILIPFV